MKAPRDRAPAGCSRPGAQDDTAAERGSSKHTSSPRPNQQFEPRRWCALCAAPVWSDDAVLCVQCGRWCAITAYVRAAARLVELL